MPRGERIPDFFIIGAPKCGTTALYSYLEGHPDIFLSPVKEPHYFYSDVAARHRMSAADYSRLFAKAGGDQLCGEGSTLYLFSRCAVADILQANPAAKLIVMVRSPLEMIVSFHRQKVYSFEENETDFTVAWRLSEARARGGRVLPTCQAPEQLDYKAVGRLGEQIERLLTTARAEQVHILVFDDFVADTATAYRSTLEFLELSDGGAMEFPVVNAHKQHRLPWISQFLMQPPFPFKQVKSLLKQRFPAQSKRAGKSVYGLNRQPVPRPEVSAELRREMAAEFADDIGLLSNLLDRDLSHWYRSAL